MSVQHVRQHVGVVAQPTVDSEQAAERQKMTGIGRAEVRQTGGRRLLPMCTSVCVCDECVYV